MRNNPVGLCLFEALFARIKKKKGYKVVIFFFTLLIYTTFHMSRKPISVVKSILHENCTEIAAKEHIFITDENITFCDWAPFDKSNWSELLGNLDLAYLLAYALSMFISGHIAERVNIRYFLTVGMFLCGISTSLFGLGFYLKIHNYYYYLVVQIFAGMVQATGWPSVVTCMGNWFGKKKRGFFMGLWNSHTSLGNILGSVIAGIFVQSAWGLSFIVPGGIIIIMGIVVFLFLTPYPEEVGCHGRSKMDQLLSTMHSAVGVMYSGSNSQSQSLNSSLNTIDTDYIPKEEDPIIRKLDEDPEENEERRISCMQALVIPGVIEYSLCLFFAKLVSYTFLFWLPTYIKRKGNLEPSVAANLSAIMDAGGIIGGIIAGIINDLTGASALTCSGMLIIAVPYLYVYYLYGLINLTYCSVFLLFLGVLVNGPYALITTAVSADLGTHETLKGNSRAIATVTAIIDGTGSLGAALGPLLTGLLLSYGWLYIFYMLMIATTLAAILLCRRVFKEINHIYKEWRKRKIEELCQENDYA